MLLLNFCIWYDSPCTFAYVFPFLLLYFFSAFFFYRIMVNKDEYIMMTYRKYPTTYFKCIRRGKYCDHFAIRCMCVCVCVGVHDSSIKRKPLIGTIWNLAQSSTDTVVVLDTVPKPIDIVFKRFRHSVEDYYCVSTGLCQVSNRSDQGFSFYRAIMHTHTHTHTLILGSKGQGSGLVSK